MIWELGCFLRWSPAEGKIEWSSLVGSVYTHGLFWLRFYVGLGHEGWVFWWTSNLVVLSTWVYHFAFSLWEHPHQYVQNFFYFAHLKPTFSILYTYFYKILTSVCLLYTFIQIKYFFFNIVNSNRERREKGKESEVKRGEREKRIKKSFTRWTVTVYIYMITVYLQDHYVYLDIFTNIDMRSF